MTLLLVLSQWTQNSHPIKPLELLQMCGVAWGFQLKSCCLNLSSLIQQSLWQNIVQWFSEIVTWYSCSCSYSLLTAPLNVYKFEIRSPCGFAYQDPNISCALHLSLLNCLFSALIKRDSFSHIFVKGGRERKKRSLDQSLSSNAEMFIYCPVNLTWMLLCYLHPLACEYLFVQWCLAS